MDGYDRPGRQRNGFASRATGFRLGVILAVGIAWAAGGRPARAEEPPAAPPEAATQGEAPPQAVAPAAAENPPAQPGDAPAAAVPVEGGSSEPAKNIGGEPPAGGEGGQPPVIPRIDAGLKDRLRAVFNEGQNAGRRAGVFAKIGDSITASRYFLQPIGCGYERLDSFADLAPTIDFFRSVPLPVGRSQPRCGAGNSFTRGGLSARVGWIAEDAFRRLGSPPEECAAPNHSALRCELVSLSPAFALVMYGTNETSGGNAERFYRAVTRLVQESLALQVIPVLSTIPPRLDKPVMAARVARFNAVITQVGQEQQVPVWNYWLALQAPDIVNNGLLRDRVHPNAYRGVYPAIFTPDALHYGYNVRNLTALQVLDKLRKVVVEDGPPDE